MKTYSCFFNIGKDPMIGKDGAPPPKILPPLPRHRKRQQLISFGKKRSPLLLIEIL